MNVFTVGILEKYTVLSNFGPFHSQIDKTTRIKIEKNLALY